MHECQTIETAGCQVNSLVVRKRRSQRSVRERKRERAREPNREDKEGAKRDREERELLVKEGMEKMGGGGKLRVSFGERQRLSEERE